VEPIGHARSLATTRRRSGLTVHQYVALLTIVNDRA
jgi:hypothetical protein